MQPYWLPQLRVRGPHHVAQVDEGRSDLTAQGNDFSGTLTMGQRRCLTCAKPSGVRAQALTPPDRVFVS